jgi:NADH:ubiquinone oxidoreductase subunit 6 (subunit J)
MMKKRNLIFLILPIFALLALFAKGGNTSMDTSLSKFLRCENGQWKNSLYYSDDVNGCPDLIEYAIRPAYVSEKSSEFILRLIPLPAGKYGLSLSNSGVVYSPYTIDVDTTDSYRIRNSKYGIAKGLTVRSKMSSDNALFFYPFDRYKGEINMLAVDDLTKSGIPGTVSAFQESLSGWILHLSEPQEPEADTNGKAVYGSITTVEWSLKRANIVFFSVLLLSILMIIALISAFVITRSIHNGKRPPSMNLLLWLATILFAILQVRTNFAGNPPIGILLDYVIVFPVLSAMLLLGILNTFYWIRRWDWDLENEPTYETTK